MYNPTNNRENAIITDWTVVFTGTNVPGYPDKIMNSKSGFKSQKEAYDWSSGKANTYVIPTSELARHKTADDSYHKRIEAIAREYYR